MLTFMGRAWIFHFQLLLFLRLQTGKAAEALSNSEFLHRRFSMFKSNSQSFVSLSSQVRGFLQHFAELILKYYQAYCGSFSSGVKSHNE